MVRSLVPRLALVALVSIGACVLADLDLEGRPCPCADGYTCDEAANVCKKTSSTATTGGSTSSATGAAGGAGASTGAAGGAGPGAGGGPPVGDDAVPLVATGGETSGLLTLSVADAFRLESDESHNWQLGRWFDTRVDPLTNLAGTSPPAYADALIDTMQTLDAMFRWCGSAQGTLAEITMHDQTPARFGLQVALDYPLPGLRVSARYWIYASGKVSIAARIENTSATTLDLLDSEYHYVSVEPSLDWSTTTIDSSHAAAFVRIDGPAPASTLQIVSLGTELPAQSDAQEWNRYWQLGAVSLEPADAIERYGALMVFPGGMNLDAMTERSQDLRTPKLFAGPGAMAVGTGFSEEMASYTVAATGTSVEFGVEADRTRFAPSFVIEGWTAPAWTLRRGSSVLLAHDDLIGPGALAWHDPRSGQLVFVHVDDIPMGAPLEERTFVLEAQ